MKSFRCGDVVPGCKASFAGSESEILDQVAHHARADHGLVQVSPDLVNAVRSAIQPA